MGAALHHTKALNTRFDIKIFLKKIKKGVDISVNLCYYNNVRRARRKPSSETHASRVRPCYPKLLRRTESCCAGYKCEPAPTGGWKYVGRGRQDDRQIFFKKFQKRG